MKFRYRPAFSYLQRCLLWLCKTIVNLRMAKWSPVLFCSLIMLLSKFTKMYSLISPGSHISQGVLIRMCAHPYSSFFHLQEPEQSCLISESTSPESSRTDNCTVSEKSQCLLLKEWQERSVGDELHHSISFMAIPLSIFFPVSHPSVKMMLRHLEERWWDQQCPLCLVDCQAHLWCVGLEWVWHWWKIRSSKTFDCF